MTNSDWEGIELTEIYDFSMPSCRSINSSLYVAPNGTKYTPSFRFVEDFGGDNIYIEAFLPSGQLLPETAEVESVVRKAIPKTILRNILIDSMSLIKATKTPHYLWENAVFLSYLEDLIVDLAAALTIETDRLFLASYHKYTLSGGTGRILNKSKAMVGFFPGLIIEYASEANGHTVDIPVIKMNGENYRHTDCVFEYMDRKHNLKVTIQGNNIHMSNDFGNCMRDHLIFDTISNSGEFLSMPVGDRNISTKCDTEAPVKQFEYRLTNLVIPKKSSTALVFQLEDKFADRLYSFMPRE